MLDMVLESERKEAGKRLEVQVSRDLQLQPLWRLPTAAVS